MKKKIAIILASLSIFSFANAKTVNKLTKQKEQKIQNDLEKAPYWSNFEKNFMQQYKNKRNEILKKNKGDKLLAAKEFDSAFMNYFNSKSVKDQVLYSKKINDLYSKYTKYFKFKNSKNEMMILNEFVREFLYN